MSPRARHGDDRDRDGHDGHDGSDGHDGHGEATLTGPGRNDPKELGTCRIEARIAAGAGSRVYRAVDMSLGRTVVVKLMNVGDDDLGGAHRFIQAGEALKGVLAPSLVQVLYTGLHNADTPYIVYEFLDGEDLDRAVKRERQLVPAAAARAILDAAQGLQAALDRGLTHGDVRPRHLIRVRGETKVTGVGLSPVFKTAQGRKLPGHPGYVAPEIAAGGGGDHRSDIYSLGATLFELVVGRAPFGTGSHDALVACAVHEPFPTLASGGVRVASELEEFLAKLTAKQAAKRFQSYIELLQYGASILPQLRKVMPHEPALVVEDGRQTGLRCAIPEGELLLGRIPGEGMNIDDARCSRRHAMVRRSGDYLEVVDLDSRNGIRVNGSEVRSKQIFPGDKIEIGDTVIRVEGAPAQPQGAVVVPVAPASPVRGAFGDVEVAHPPASQANADSLQNASGAGAEQRLRLLAKLAPLLAQRTGGPAEVSREILGVLGEVLGADDKCLVRIIDGLPLFEASTSHEAQVLSCCLPAIERALPGQLSLATAVKVGRDDRWTVLLAPIFAKGQVTALVVLVKTQGHFDEHALGILEAACALLSMRAESTPPVASSAPGG